METTAVHFHATPEIAAGLNLTVKDTHEVAGVAWKDMDSITAMYASHYDWLCIVRERLDDEMRQKPIHKQFHGDDWMVDGEKLSVEEIAVAILWRKFDKDALTKRLCPMLAQAGAAQLRIVIEGDDDCSVVCGFKRARTATS